MPFKHISVIAVLLWLALAACNAPPLYGKNAEEFLKAKGEPDALIESLKYHRLIGVDDAQRLAGYDNIAVLHLVGANPGTPVSILLELAEHANSEVRTGVAINRNTPLDTLLGMRTPGSYTTLNTMLARNPALPEAILWEMQRQGESSLSSFGYNPSSPPDLLRLVMKQGTNMDRVSIANNASLPVDVMLELLKDPDGLVRAYLALNPALPEEIMIELARDPDERVRQWLSRHPDLTDEAHRLIDGRRS